MSQDVNKVSIGPYEAGDEQAILEVFEKVFEIKRSLAAWRWEYAQNPAGLHVFLARTAAGGVVSQFAGIPRRLKLRDGAAVFSEIVDSLTDPDFRQGLKKPGIFASTCYRFVDHFGKPDREAVMYGLPNPPAFRVGRALLGYTPMYHIEFLVRPLADMLPAADDGFAGGEGSARQVDRFAPDVDGLYERFAAHHPVLTVRDATYLNWRYRHPEAEYCRFEFRDQDGHLFGLAVLRHAWLGAPHTALAEWMVEPAHALAPAALEHLQRCAAGAGSEQLKFLAPPGSDVWAGFERAGFVPEKSRFRLVARTYDAERIPLDWLRDNWFISLGDFDIV